MREIVNISLPTPLKKEVDRIVKKGEYASRSEFFRHLLRLWKSHELLNEVKESETEFKSGKGKTLRSLSELR